MPPRNPFIFFLASWLQLNDCESNVHACTSVVHTKRKNARAFMFMC